MTKKVIVGMIAVVLVAALCPNLHAQFNIIEEDFETPRPDWLPTDWDTVQTNPLEPWAPTYPHSLHWWHFQDGDLLYSSDWGIDDGTACCWWDNNMSDYFQDEWLITPEVDLTDPDYYSATLYFSSAFYRGTPHNYVCVSTDGGVTWEDTLIDLTHDVEGSGYLYITDYPNPFEFDLIDYLGETIRIGFNYWDNTGSTPGLQTVDEVVLEVEGGEPPSGDSLDLEMMRVIRPNTYEEAGVAFTPACEVYNNLDTTANASLRCDITELAGPTVYQDALSNVPLESGDNEIYGFKDFIPEANIEYTALFVVEHPDDVNPDNNHITKDFIGEVTADVTAIEIIKPTDPQVNPFEPTAVFAERADKESTEAALICQITDQTFHAVVYGDTIFNTFAAKDTFNAVFKQAADLTEGTYTVTFWAADPSLGESLSHPEDTSLTFGYSGVTEEPVVLNTSLEVQGRRVNYTLAQASEVAIRVYDVTGSVVEALVSGTRDAGSHSVIWDARDAASGVYFVRMIAGSESYSEKLLLIR